MLSEKDEEDLAQLKRLWEMTYCISTDGFEWVARRRADPGTVLSKPDAQSLLWAIQGDCLKTDDGSGYYVERQSGPPVYVPARTPATARVPNSTA